MNQRMFGNKVYFMAGSYTTKKAAVQEAERIRNGKIHWFVRVVPSGKRWQVWRR